LYLQTLTPTLTTTAFDRSNLEWFEARSWKLASKGLPSSLTQLVHAQVSFSLRNLLFVRYGTHKTKPIFNVLLPIASFRRSVSKAVQPN
jgi:hypothetical protein